MRTTGWWCRRARCRPRRCRRPCLPTLPAVDAPGHPACTRSRLGAGGDLPPDLEVLLLRRADSAWAFLAVGHRQPGCTRPSPRPPRRRGEVHEDTGLDAHAGTVSCTIGGWSTSTHSPPLAAPLRPGCARHRAGFRPAGAPTPGRDLESPRAHGICLDGLARGGRLLHLARPTPKRSPFLFLPLHPVIAPVPLHSTRIQRRRILRILRVATYNIHKGVQEGLGPTRRLEIHNLGLAVEQLDADIVCLQEVRKPQPQRGTVLRTLARRSPGRVPGPRGLRGGLP